MSSDYPIEQFVKQKVEEFKRHCGSDYKDYMGDVLGIILKEAMDKERSNHLYGVDYDLW